MSDLGVPKFTNRQKMQAAQRHVELLEEITYRGVVCDELPIWREIERDLMMAVGREVIMAGSIPEPNSGCWIWLGSSTGGYGYVGVGGHAFRAPRLSYEAFNGPLDDGLFACHRCDTPPCVNPEHLFPGTHAENMADMVRKGRAALHTGRRHRPHLSARGDGNPMRLYPESVLRGELSTAAILTDEAVREIRRSTERQVDLAERFGVRQSAVSKVRQRKTWKHVKD